MKKIFYFIMGVLTVVCVSTIVAIVKYEPYITFIGNNVETITSSEMPTFLNYCRCHNDGGCYGGNEISFRPICATFIVEVVNPGGSIAFYNCRDYDYNCEK